MKKDIFNGKIKKEHAGTALFSIILGTVVFAVCAVVLLCFGMFYEGLEYNVSTLMIVASVICFVCVPAFPAATIICARTYPKHKKLAHLLLKDYMFVELPDESKGHDE